ncbi:MAG: hypothetical protein U0996_08740 [Planctomycetaceae bacterium]
MSSRTVSQLIRATLVIHCAFLTSAALGQEAAAPAPVAPATQPAAPTQEAPAAAAPTPVAQPAAAPQNAADPCLQSILEEQQKTRLLREMRQPLPYPAKDEATKLKRAFAPLLKSGYSNAADTKTAQDYLSWLLLRSTDPEFVSNPDNVQQMLKDIESDIQNSGRDLGNAERRLPARKKFCGDVLATTRKMLENSLDARITAVNVIKFLFEVPAVTAGPPARFYGEALTTLLEVVASKDQPDSVKVCAANSLRFVLRNCDVSEQDQFRIVDALGNELARPCTQSAYQQSLLETLIEIKRPRKTIGVAEPTSMKHFVAVLEDKARPIEVRCLAAFGVGQGPFDADMKLEPLAWKIAQLAGDTAIEFNKSPGDAKWPWCGACLIFAFRHTTQADAAAALPDRKGLMNRAPQSAAIASVVPHVQVVAVKLIENSGKFSAAELQPLAQWINANKPANLTWASNAPPLKP